MCEVNTTLERQIPTQRWLVVIESCLPSPHCLVAQDVALSRPKRGFEFLWGHKNQQLFSKRGSPEGDSIRIPLGHKSTIILNSRILGRSSFVPMVHKSTIFSKRGSPEGDSIRISSGGIFSLSLANPGWFSLY